MEKSNISYKLFLWALLPMLCFTIAIYGVKWYCDTVIPPEFKKFEQISTVCNTRYRNISTSGIKFPKSFANFFSKNKITHVADVTSDFPMLASKVLESSTDSTTQEKVSNNTSHKAGTVYVFANEHNRWICYNNSSQWTIKAFSFPYFASTVLNISWFLSLGICIICIIIDFNSLKKFRRHEINGILKAPISIWLAFISFAIWHCLATEFFRFDGAYYPEWIFVAFIFSEIAVIYTAFIVISRNKSTDSINKFRLIYPLYTYDTNLTDSLFGKYIPAIDRNNNKNNITTIILNDGWLLIEENKKWKKFSCQMTESNDIFATNDNECFVINCSYCYLPNIPINRIRNKYQLNYKDIEFTIDGISIKSSLNDSVHWELSNINLYNRFINFILRKKTQYDESRINQLFLEAYDTFGIRTVPYIIRYIKHKLKQEKQLSKS